MSVEIYMNKTLRKSYNNGHIYKLRSLEYLIYTFVCFAYKQKQQKKYENNPYK